MLMVLFFCGEERFICDCEFIEEVIPCISVDAIENTPAFLLGVANFGGIPVPIIDWSLFIDHHPSQDAMHTRILLFKMEDEEGKKVHLGVKAERVTQTVDIDPRKFIPSPVIRPKMPFLGPIFQDEKGLVQVVLVTKLFESLSEILFKNIKFSSKTQLGALIK